MPDDIRISPSSDHTNNDDGEQSQKAQSVLNDILGQGTAEEIIQSELSRTSIESERQGAHVIERETGRERSRVLFVTKDPSYLEEKSVEILSLEALMSLFDEMHIIVMLPLGGKEVVKRLHSNMWIYSVRARYWWQLPEAALKAAKNQLSFADGFRPDIIVGLDPFESGLAAHRIARAFGRPYQVHVTEDFFLDRYKKAEKHNKWRVRMAKYVLKRTDGVRTTTTPIAQSLAAHLPNIRDVQVLPQFHNFRSFLDAEPAFNVHGKYKDFLYVALAFGPLTADSHLHDTFSALNQVLQNPRIGLVVIGKGPARSLFEEKIELLGIKRNVVLLPEAPDLVSYLKTADVLVQTDVSKESEDIVLQAAAAGLPTVMFKTDLREDLFDDGESASLCEVGDVHGIQQGFKALLNNIALRRQYKNAARHVVETRLVEDRDVYYRALRDSIEVTLNADAGSGVVEAAEQQVQNGSEVAMHMPEDTAEVVKAKE